MKRTEIVREDGEYYLKCVFTGTKTSNSKRYYIMKRRRFWFDEVVATDDYFNVIEGHYEEEHK